MTPPFDPDDRTAHISDTGRGRVSRRGALGMLGGLMGGIYAGVPAAALTGGWSRRAAAAEPTAGDAALMQANGLGEADVAYALFDPYDGTMLAARAGDRPVIPASTLKVPAMVAGLGILGPDYKFPTILAASGVIEGGVLRGDLTLLGGGDPYLDNGGLIEILAQFRQLGITRVEGRFVIDDSLLVGDTQIDPTQPYGAAYNPGLSALSVNFNRIQVSWRRTGEAVTGSALAVAHARNIPCPWVVVQPGSASPFRPIEGREGWILSTRINPTEGTNVLPVRYPSLLAGGIFRTLCQQAEIAIPEPVQGPVPPGSSILAVHDSIPLSRMIPGILENSNNMAAETVAMMSARALVTRAIDRPQAGALLAQWFAQNVGECDWSTANFPAMSGLSTRNQITPAQMAAVLRFGHASGRVPDIEPALSAMSWGSPGLGPGRVRAKTGTMFWVRSLAGFIQCDSGRKRGFALFLTDAARRAALSAAADPNDHSIPNGSRAWLNRAKIFERDILVAWARAH